MRWAHTTIFWCGNSPHGKLKMGDKNSSAIDFSGSLRLMTYIKMSMQEY
jgi:hypothetical protein